MIELFGVSKKEEMNLAFLSYGSVSVFWESSRFEKNVWLD